MVYYGRELEEELSSWLKDGPTLPLSPPPSFPGSSEEWEVLCLEYMRELYLRLIVMQQVNGESVESSESGGVGG